VVCDLYLLAILVRNHMSNQLIMRKVKGGEAVIRLLGAPQEPVKQKAALALGAYCLNNIPIQGEVSKAIPILCNILKAEGAQPLTRCTVSACLAAMCDNHSSNQMEVKAVGGLRDIAALIVAWDRSGVPPKVSLNLLSALVSSNPTIQNHVVTDHPNVVPHLVGFLRNPPNPEILPIVTNTIVELCKKNIKSQAVLYGADIIPPLVKVIEPPAAEDTVLNSLYILGSLWKLRRFQGKIRTEYNRLKLRDQLRILANSKNRNVRSLAATIEKNLDKRV